MKVMFALRSNTVILRQVQRRPRYIRGHQRCTVAPLIVNSSLLLSSPLSHVIVCLKSLNTLPPLGGHSIKNKCPHEFGSKLLSITVILKKNRTTKRARHSLIPYILCKQIAERTSLMCLITGLVWLLMNTGALRRNSASLGMLHARKWGRVWCVHCAETVALLRLRQWKYWI